MDRAVDPSLTAREPGTPARRPLHGEHTLRVQTRQRLLVLIFGILALSGVMASPAIHQTIRHLVDQIAYMLGSISSLAPHEQATPTARHDNSSAWATEAM